MDRRKYADEEYALWWVSAYSTLHRLKSEMREAARTAIGNERDELMDTANELAGAINHLGLACPAAACSVSAPEAA